MMLYFALFFNVGFLLASAVFLNASMHVPAAKAIEVVLYTALGLGYLMLCWSTLRHNTQVKNAVLTHLAIVYFAISLCSIMPFLLSDPGVIDRPQVVLVAT